MPVKPEKVEWYMGGKKVETDSRHKMQVDGNTLTLLVSDVQTLDAGEVTVRIGDKSSTAKLTVEGNFLNCCYKILTFPLFKEIVIFLFINFHDSRSNQQHWRFYD